MILYGCPVQYYRVAGTVLVQLESSNNTEHSSGLFVFEAAATEVNNGAASYSMILYHAVYHIVRV